MVLSPRFGGSVLGYAGVRMSLSERAKAGPPPRYKPRCTVDKLLSELDHGEAQALRAMLDEGSGWTHAGIADALAGEGLRVGTSTVGRHRTRRCVCDW